jgi:hypothetical protein
MFFERKRDNTLTVSIVSSAIGATVGALATIFLIDPKNRKAVSAFVSHALDSTSKKGEEVIDMTSKAIEKNVRKNGRNRNEENASEEE